MWLLIIGGIYIFIGGFICGTMCSTMRLAAVVNPKRSKIGFWVIFFTLLMAAIWPLTLLGLLAKIKRRQEKDFITQHMDLLLDAMRRDKHD